MASGAGGVKRASICGSGGGGKSGQEEQWSGESSKGKIGSGEGGSGEIGSGEGGSGEGSSFRGLGGERTGNGNYIYPGCKVSWRGGRERE
jgi:hypothetical protein